ncbi:uncharacterized protein LOC142776498 [Rhipicephalus microplus]|uniref:uncharacterized protein LOC142776498 n=1 Tax=Rhipicephalus microplus TaxID=6941 RepID=UPI003F6D5975
MATRNKQRVLFCGFRRIENVDDYFKRNSLRRGIDFYASNHVYGVKEEIISANGPADVIGKCVAQMKSLDYDVRLQLYSQPRHMMAASCTCEAGCRGWCKHTAVLAVFVNKWESTSCTDLPCAWPGPSARLLLHTKKKIKDRFTGGTRSGASVSRVHPLTGSKHGKENLTALQNHLLRHVRFPLRLLPMEKTRKTKPGDSLLRPYGLLFLN